MPYSVVYNMGDGGAANVGAWVGGTIGVVVAIVLLIVLIRYVKANQNAISLIFERWTLQLQFNRL